MCLKDKHIVIMGASSGLGKESAYVLSKLGAKLTLVARNKERLSAILEELNGINDRYYSYDLNDLNGLRDLIGKIVKEQGPLDGMCFCAGITGAKALRPLKMTKPDFVKNMLNVHTLAFIEAVRCLAERKNLNERASIVGVSSVAAYRATLGEYAYASAKAANDAFVRSAALELSRKNVRINSISFGAIDSEAYQSALIQTSDESKLLENQYMGLIQMESAAKYIAFLLGDSLPQMTGTVLEYFAGR